ncbi:MAG: alpha/beta family hydrolase [Acidobacteriota bacterium]|nr:alpha/beta family hydrolase [Acidobacteriota bacterium]
MYPPSSQPTTTLILAHGAGAGQQHPFMVAFARGLAERGLEVVTFNFQYTEQGRRAPDRAPKLEACYRATIETISGRAGVEMRPLLIGGKSMGGRIASQIAATPSPDGTVAMPAVRVSGLVLLGYPLHPPGRPDKRRDAHLPRITAPVLVIQGARDPFGTESEFRPVMARMRSATLHVVEAGDHSFNIRRKNAPSRDDTYAGVMDEIVRWTRDQTRDVVTPTP